jgi:hypothetical protein
LARNRLQPLHLVVGGRHCRKRRIQLPASFRMRRDQRARNVAAAYVAQNVKGLGSQPIVDRSPWKM